MTSPELESALRECLSRQAAPSRTVPHLAESAILGAHRVRHRRSGAAAAAAVVATMAVAAGGWQLSGSVGHPGSRVPVAEAERAPFRPDPAAPPTATPAAEPLPDSARLEARPLAAVPRPPVDLVVDARLDTTRGERIDLSVLGTVTQARRGGGGWLVAGSTRAARAALWFVAPGATPKALLPAADAVALAPDGRRVTWLAAGRTSVATVVDGRLTGIRQTPVPPRTRPIAFAGDAVLLTRQLPSGEIEGYGVWSPERGPYQAAWNASLVGVYGPLPDGRTVVAQVAGDTGRPCLALLDTRPGLPVVKRACALPLAAGAAGAVSPDGRWLVANAAPAPPGAAAPAETALLVELRRAFDARPAAHQAGPRLTGPAVWTDPETVIHPGGAAELVRVSVERLVEGEPGAVERTPVAGARPDDQVIVVSGVPG